MTEEKRQQQFDRRTYLNMANQVVRHTVHVLENYRPARELLGVTGIAERLATVKYVVRAPVRVEKAGYSLADSAMASNEGPDTEHGYLFELGNYLARIGELVNSRYPIGKVDLADAMDALELVWKLRRIVDADKATR